jgi:uncharacterized RmlC-like cupin family protein
MAETAQACIGGVEVVPAAAIGAAVRTSNGRATAFDFRGVGSDRTWLGMVALAPGGRTGGHHHGRHEVAVFVVRGHGRIEWGERLDSSVDIGAGDFVYFPPYVPHREINLDATMPLEFVVVRSDNEPIVVDLDLG